VAAGIQALTTVVWFTSGVLFGVVLGYLLAVLTLKAPL
jgi:F0F1-type ATP synthase assembly protein I